MSRKFIATILAASLAITSLSAAPARASDDDLARFLVGTTALLLFGAALSDRNRDRGRRQDVVEPPRPRPDRRALPERCLIRAETAVGPRRVFRAKCLERHYPRAHRLPRTCQLPIWTDRGRRPAYLASCLRDKGYSVARR